MSCTWHPLEIRDRDAEACGKCHRRGEVEQVDAKDGFIEHHEQYEELFQGKHAALDCVLCHNPHEGVKQLEEAKLPTTRTQCINCHFEKAKEQKNAKHAALKPALRQSAICPRLSSQPGLIQPGSWVISAHLMAIDQR
jgi:hypothetical protein